MLTTREVAEELRVSRSKILDWIASGSLRAINVASNLSSRPRYRIQREDLAKFLASRSVAPVSRRRTQPCSNVIEFYR